MFTLFLTKVKAILGGLRDNSELELVRSCYDKGLSVTATKQVVINNR